MTNVPSGVHAGQAGRRERWKERGRLHGPLFIYIMKAPRTCSPAKNHILVFCKRGVERGAEKSGCAFVCEFPWRAHANKKNITGLRCLVTYSFP
jgi:hypothetical protein